MLDAAETEESEWRAVLALASRGLTTLLEPAEYHSRFDDIERLANSQLGNAEEPMQRLAAIRRTGEEAAAAAGG